MLINDPAAFSTAGAWSLNVCSSVGIILVNKAVMQTFLFRFATCLTAMHFIVTFIAGYLAKRYGYLSAESRVPFWTIFGFSVMANISVVSLNLSLMTNSVGFYQIAKLSIIPACCFFEYLLHGKRFSRNIIITVIIVMVGVGICTVTDVQVHLVGLLFAVTGVVTTTLQQIFVGSLQKNYNIGSFDLLSQTAPVQAAILVVCGPFVDFIVTRQNVFDYRLSFGSIGSILLSCALALFVNISSYLCIGKFSAVSFQVLGHMKTICVLTLGWLLFDSAITLKLAGGMSIAIFGMVLYSAAVEREKRATEKGEVGGGEADSGALKRVPLSHISGNTSEAEDEKENLISSSMENGTSELMTDGKKTSELMLTSPHFLKRIASSDHKKDAATGDEKTPLL